MVAQHCKCIKCHWILLFKKEGRKGGRGGGRMEGVMTNVNRTGYQDSQQDSQTQIVPANGDSGSPAQGHPLRMSLPRGCKHASQSASPTPTPTSGPGGEGQPWCSHFRVGKCRPGNGTGSSRITKRSDVHGMLGGDSGALPSEDWARTPCHSFLPCDFSQSCLC